MRNNTRPPGFRSSDLAEGSPRPGEMLRGDTASTGLDLRMAARYSRHEKGTKPLTGGKHAVSLVSRAGLEPDSPTDRKQVTDSMNRQKTPKSSFRRFEVHGGYTGYE